MKVKSMVILGGGTSAWMTASYFRHNFSNLDITVIDKEFGSPVGVGEGTLLKFPDFLERCGLNFHELFKSIGATFKNGILFKNWKETGSNIWHPFFVNPEIESEDGYKFPLIDIWSNHQNFDFKRYGTGIYDISMKNEVCRNIDTAYHVDCGKLVQYLQSYFVHNGVKFIKSEMINANYERENITSLELKNGQVVRADLFVDCTGFKSLLNKTPARIDLSDRLFCNTALAGHVPYVNKTTEMKPYVISEAVDHGWVWTIPVKDRIGSGIVFNRDITDPETAKDYFVNYWDNRISKDNLKLINWDPFYNKNMWHGNVVSIGLSAGFIEPLESTGIALIIEGIYQLSNRICDLYYRKLDIDIYNSTMSSFFEECVDFVNMHYHNNTRNTEFWSFVKDRFLISEKHQHYLDVLKDNSSLNAIVKTTNFFTQANWNLWLIQLGAEVTPRSYLNKDLLRSSNCLKSWKKFQETLLTDKHFEIIDKLNY